MVDESDAVGAGSSTLENPFLDAAGGGMGGLGLQDLASTLQDPKVLQDALRELQDPETQSRIKAMMEDPAFQDSMKQYMEQMMKDPQFDKLKEQVGPSELQTFSMSGRACCASVSSGGEAHRIVVARTLTVPPFPHPPRRSR